jgi:hypothetical protein
VARRSVDGTAAISQDLPEPAECPVTCEMAKSIVNLLQPIEVEKYNGKFPAGSAGSADLGLQHFEQAAVIGQTGQRIAQRLMPQLVFKPSLLGNVNGDDFVASKVSVVVVDASAA